MKKTIKFKNIVVLPLGSYEYHGTELPSNTDSIIAEHVAKDFAGQFQNDSSLIVDLLPTLNFGLSFEHSGLPKTAYVFHQTFYNFIFELLESIKKDNSLLVIINGHGGNFHTLSAIESDFNYSNNKCKLISFSPYPAEIKERCKNLFGEFDTHAGSVESSLVAYYHSKPKREYSTPKQKTFPGLLRFYKSIDFHKGGVIKELPVIISDPKKGKILHYEIVTSLYIFASEMLERMEKFK